jgi:hypothetical protein
MGVKQDHVEVFLALLRAAPPVGSPMVVHHGRVPNGSVPPYVLAYFTTTRPDGTSLTNEQDEAVTRAILHCVAGQALDGDGTAVTALADRVEAAVLGVTPTVPGRSCWPIRDDGDSPPPEVDESTDIAVWTQRVGYRLSSVPG